MAEAPLHFIVTAGPTREYLDPVRFLSNPSTGKMGFAVASLAHSAGYAATLVAGPVNLPTLRGVTRHDVISARDMLSAVIAEVEAAVAAGERAVLVMAAAVADFRPAVCAAAKIKKSSAAKSPVLQLARNPDILKEVRAHFAVSGGILAIGFAAETGDPVVEASRKCREKGLAFIVANDVTEKGCGFGTDTNRVTIIYPNGTKMALPMLSKRQVARQIVKSAVLEAERFYGGR